MYKTSDNYKTKIYEASTRHLLKIYINGVEIDKKYILDCKISQTLFSNDEFTLGTVTSKAVELKLHKSAIQGSIENVYIVSGIEDEVVPIGYFNLEEINREDDYTVTLKLLDNMIKFEFNYDGSKLNYPCNLMTILKDICLKAGVELGSTSFLNEEYEVAVYDNTISARTYISYIAEQSGGFACIGRDGKLYIKIIGEDKTELSLKYFQDFKWGEKFKFTRVRYEDGIQLFEKGDETGNTIYINQDNMYIVEQEQINNIYNKLNDLEIYGFEGNSIIDPSIDIGDLLLIDGKYIIYQGTTQYVGKFKANISSKIQCKAKEETTSRIPSQKKINRRVQSQINQIDGEIKQVVAQVDGQNQKISETLQKVDEITTKISDIADITVSKESTNAILEFEDINQSEPISIKIHPIGANISYLYPHENLYPADDLFMTTRTLRFTNTSTNEIFDYELPDDLLIYDNENYDEFVFSYDSLSVMINKKCCYNADGTVGLLDVPKTINYDFPKIELTDGDYKVELLGYSNVYMFVRLMAQNIYTTQFATKAELNSEINQTTEEVNIGVNKKLENYSTTEEMNSAINVKANQITSSVNEKFENYDTSSEVSTKIQQSADSITNTVKSTYTTKTDTEKQINSAKSEFKQTTDNISSEVSKKVGNNEIISKINQSAETVGIDANKIELSAEDVLNLLAGNEINLGSKKITIKSDNFTVDENGNVIMKNAQITGGKIHVEDTGNVDENASIIAESDNYIAEMLSSGFFVENKNNSNSNFVIIMPNSLIALDENRYGFDFGIGSDGKIIWIVKDKDGKIINVSDTQFNLYSPGQATNLMLGANGAYINGYKIQTNTSDKRLKNNIKDSSEKALEKIMQIQHRSFEWKESGVQQKNGYIAQELEEIDREFVINENDKYSINVLNLLATVTKAIQEQQKEIENLKGAK